MVCSPHNRQSDLSKMEIPRFHFLPLKPQVISHPKCGVGPVHPCLPLGPHFLPLSAFPSFSSHRLLLLFLRHSRGLRTFLQGAPFTSEHDDPCSRLGSLAPDLTTDHSLRPFTSPRPPYLRQPPLPHILYLLPVSVACSTS